MKHLTFLIFVGALFFASPVAAEPDLAEQTLTVADGHYYDGDYYRAISEYQRFLTLYPSDPRAFAVELKVAWIYHVAERPENAAFELKRLQEKNDDDRRARWLSLYRGQTLLETEPLAAKNAFESVQTACKNDDSKECSDLTAYAVIGETRYFVSQLDFDSAVVSLREMPKNSIQYATATDVADYVDGLRIPRRSPFLAGALSIVPGLGHFYLGEWGIGLVALLWNGAFIAATVDSVLAERYGQAALIGLLELIWYGGTMFGAVAGAHRFNRDAKQIVADGMTRDLNEMDVDIPWAARFPIDYPTPLKLKVRF